MVMNTVQQHYPSPSPVDLYMRKTAATLATIGFSAENTLPIIAVCRDEVCATFIRSVENHWGNSFTLGGLAGLPFGGVTEIGAASQHAPDIYDRKRYVIYAMAHIGFGPNGEVGGCVRPGMKDVNGACGVLITYTQQLADSTVDPNVYTDDAEFGMLKHRMAKVVPSGAPDLLAVTNAALTAIKEDIDSLTSSLLSHEDCDFAVFTGTQLHLPDQTLVQASDSWVLLNGQRRNINFKD